jgi:hypothetical protein
VKTAPLCRVAVAGEGAVGPVDGGRGEDPGGGAAQAEPGVVVDPVEDLGVGAVDQRPLGDVGLPALVGLFGGEAVGLLSSRLCGCG